MGRAFEYRKATKFARWDKMAKEFSKAGKQITMAVKEGGPDPEANHKLKRAITNAKGVQMPKDRIAAAIKKASDKDTSDYKEVVYEGMAPHGISVVIETATDNPTRTVANVRLIFNKNGGSIGTQGMHDFIFDRKGLFVVKKEDLGDLEELEFELIDAGLEKMEDNEENEVLLNLYVGYTDFGTMSDALEAKGLNSEKADLVRLPNHTKELGDDEMDEVLDLIDKLEQNDDVQNVYHNLA